MYKDKKEYNLYQRGYQLERYHSRRQEAFQFLGGKCVVCGTKEGLEIDHKVAAQKEIQLSKLWSIAKDRYLKELEKCQLLCTEHHKIKTKICGDNTSGGHNRIDNYGHGTWHMYTKDKCRCDICRQWRRDYRNKKVNSMGNLR